MRVKPRVISSLKPELHLREGREVSVIRREHALIDSLAELRYAPPLSELLSAFSALPQDADLDELVRYTLDKQSPLLCARVGFFLMCSLKGRIDNGHLLALERAGLRHPASFRRTQRERDDASISRWRLFVPGELWPPWAALFR